eukprot:scaffold8383_cov277-Pinguiococcus_pyrenoidosus.AAC.2
MRDEFDREMTAMAKGAPGRQVGPRWVSDDISTDGEDGQFIALEAGDVVKVRQGALWFEGMVVTCRADGTVYVDMGEPELEKFDRSDVVKVQNWHVVEVGDTVEVSQGFLKFLGQVTSIDLDGALTVEYDDGEVEVGIARSAVRKLQSIRSRPPALLWKKAINSLKAARAFRIVSAEGATVASEARSHK